jgi:dolichol-phosphate mannosyltransferase
MDRVVVIPARDEEDSIEELVRAAFRVGEATHVYVANDSSTDSTELMAQHAGAIVVPVPASRRGLAGVYRHGLQAAVNVHGMPALYAEMDAGGSHDPAALPDFWEALKHADIATGRRFGTGQARYNGSYRRALLSLAGTFVTNVRAGTKWWDATSGFIAYRGYALETLLLQPQIAEGHYYQTEVRLNAERLRLNIVEVPIVYKNSSSSLNWKSIREALRLSYATR